jgi:hypothetical protein
LQLFPHDPTFSCSFLVFLINPFYVLFYFNSKSNCQPFLFWVYT